MLNSKNAFTLIELIFLIIIIAILGKIALPKLSATRDDAYIAQNTGYIVGIITEVSTFIITKNFIKNDLTEMSEILKMLEIQGRVIIDTSNQSVEIEIGEQENCLKINIVSDATSEILKTSFSSSTNRVCKMVAESIDEKEYKIVLRGRRIRY